MTKPSDSLCEFRPRVVEIDIDVWTKIVWAAKESDDWKLRTLIEQAVMGAQARG